MTENSVKTLMAVAWVKIQTPRKITLIEEETSTQGAMGFTMRFEFTTKVQGDIKEKLSVPFLRRGAGGDNTR